MSSVLTEKVLVVPTELFHSIGHFQGFCTDTEKYLPTLLNPANISFRERSEMEADPSFKQLIPYVVFTHVDDNGDRLVFQYQRGVGQGEARLHKKRSIGIGGHISSTDENEHSTYDDGLQRELDEEVTIQSSFEIRRAGMINDDLNDVGKVHLGVVHICELQHPNVVANESEIVQAGFVSVEQLHQQLDEYETWSQICIKSLFAE